MLNERLGKLHFWLFLIGFHLTFDVMHIREYSHARRIYTYEPGPRMGHDELSRDHRRIRSGHRHAGVCSEPYYFLLQRSEGGETILGRLDSRMAVSSPPPVYNFASIPTVASPKAVVGSEASGRPDSRYE